MSYHMPHRVRGTRGCNGEDVVLASGDRIPCRDGLEQRPVQIDPRAVRDPWQDPANWPDAPAANCPIYHGDACEGAH